MPKDTCFNDSYGARTPQSSESVISEKKKVVVLLNDFSFQFNKLFNKINKPTLEFREKNSNSKFCLTLNDEVDFKKKDC
ncbi:hypothetical protein BpHYR1_052792 [Brachionus plicatilis]|uniref:Uncharacterized protein n=1 Tax=Brachionus plicatilis TaxID=10195 RepID=A0A3M7T184_BRAPC|nr:hypothetical protein BpHYR1_052792 [Brachionus plicatilis]